MSDTRTPNPADVLGVKSRVSWGALTAGAMVALSLYIILSMLGVALGIEAAVRRGSTQLGTASAIYAIVVLLVAMFFGGWATSRLAVGETKMEAILYGLILWGVLFLGMIWMVGIGLRAGFGGIVSIATGAYTVTRDASGEDSSTGMVDALRRRYDSDLGSDKFVEDLRKIGLNDEQAKKVQGEVSGRIKKLRDDPASLPQVAGELSNKPEVQQAARDTAEGVRQASWWTLAGMIISMATVIIGSLTGSGEMLQLVPILGVRRPPSSPRI